MWCHAPRRRIRDLRLVADRGARLHLSADGWSIDDLERAGREG
jgi:hypothetical protein